MVLLFTDPTKIVGGAKGFLLCELPKVGGAIAPPVPPPLSYIPHISSIISRKEKMCMENDINNFLKVLIGLL